MYDWLLIFGLVLWVGSILWFFSKPCASVFHPAAHYLLIHGVLFAVRPIFAWWLGFNVLYGAIGFQPTMAEKATVLLCADLALVVFLLVSTGVGGRPMVRASQAERGPPPRFDKAFLLALAVCVPIGIISLTIGIEGRASGLSTMVLDKDSGIVMNTTENGYLHDAQLMLWSSVTLIAWIGRLRLLSLIPLACYAIAKAATGGRWPIIIAVIATGLFYLYEKRRRWPPVQWGLLAIPLIALFTMLGIDRGQFVRQLFGGSATINAEYFAMRPLESMDYGNMEFFEYIVHNVPKATGTYDLFTSNSRILVEPVPRVLWPGKPVGAPINLVKLWKYGTAVGATNSVPGQGWLDAGWLGVVLWSAAFGLLFGKAYDAFVTSRQTRFQTALYILFVAACIQFFRDGVLLTIVKFALFPFLIVFVWRGASWLFDRAPATSHKAGGVQGGHIA